uniref:Glucosylceramidase n=1 Tax=Apteryx owenii TaxID=8824 RepID=A0A8B9QI28_APTOW
MRGAAPAAVLGQGQACGRCLRSPVTEEAPGPPRRPEALRQELRCSRGARCSSELAPARPSAAGVAGLPAAAAAPRSPAPLLLLLFPSQYESSKAGKRLERSEGSFPAAGRLAGLLLTLSASELYQRVKGFGGSLSDAAALNILGLSRPAQDRLLRSYFSEAGIEYNLVRLPMGCSDFSERPYSYADIPHDYELRHFKLAEEDTRMKASIPILHRASAMSKRPLSLYASPWTAPAWMKSNGDIRGKGSLKGQAGDKYHRAWASYFVKFLDEYAKRNVTFWAVTAQNEPLATLLAPAKLPTVIFTAVQQRDFILRNLGPALAQSAHRTRIIILDDQRIHLPAWAQVVLGNASAARYVAGVGVHWYLDALVPARSSLEATHRLFPRHLLLYTEACSGFLTLRFAVALGCWERGDRYSHSILSVRHPPVPPRGAGRQPRPRSAPPLLPGPEPLRGGLDRLEPGAGPAGGPQLGQELRGQPHHCGPQQGRLLQAAHVLPPGALQVGWGQRWACVGQPGGPETLPSAMCPVWGSQPRSGMLLWGGGAGAAAGCCSTRSSPRSKFIPEGSRRVGLASSRKCPLCDLEHVALLRPDGAAVLVVLNR